MKRFVLFAALLFCFTGTATAQDYTSEHSDADSSYFSMHSIGIDTLGGGIFPPSDEKESDLMRIFHVLWKYQGQIPGCKIRFHVDQNPAPDMVDRIRDRVESYKMVLWIKATARCEKGAVERFNEYL
jgi:hypothetical protein